MGPNNLTIINVKFYLECERHQHSGQEEMYSGKSRNSNLTLLYYVKPELESENSTSPDFGLRDGAMLPTMNSFPRGRHG